MYALQTAVVSLLAVSSLHGVETFPRKAPTHPFGARDAPGWCLIVFGPKHDLHVWLAVDNDRCLIDRNADGSLSDETFNSREQGRRTFALGTIQDRQRNVTYRDLKVTTRSRSGGPDLFSLAISVPGKFEQEVREMPLGPTPESAPVVFLDGPLGVYPLVRKPGLGLVEPKTAADFVLPRASQAVRIIAYVGTPNLGEHARPTCVRSCSEGDVAPGIALDETFYPAGIVTFVGGNPATTPNPQRIRIDDD